jgi:hypothetical protein
VTQLEGASLANAQALSSQSSAAKKKKEKKMAR